MNKYIVICRDDRRTFVVTVEALDPGLAASQAEWLPTLPFVQITRVERLDDTGHASGDVCDSAGCPIPVGAHTLA